MSPQGGDSSLAERRGPASPDLGTEVGADQGPDQGGSELASGSGSGGSTRAEAVGQEGVRQALSGAGGAFDAMVAAELLLSSAGFDPRLLGSDSNSSVQQVMMAGGGQGQPGMEQAISGLVGGGSLPDLVTNRLQTATGGTMGPMSGAPGSLPGIARHFVDPARSAGQQGAPRRDSGDVGQIFGAMASMPEADLDRTLREAGRGFR